MHTAKTLFTALIAVAFTTVGCSDDSSPTGPATSSVEPPAFDVTGTWWIDEDVSSNCSNDGDRSYSIEVIQDGSDLIVSTDSGVFDGRISGRTISWTGSYFEQGGMTTIESMTLVVSERGDGELSLSGSARWRWSDGSDVCTGSTQVVGQHIGF